MNSYSEEEDKHIAAVYSAVATVTDKFAIEHDTW